MQSSPRQDSLNTATSCLSFQFNRFSSGLSHLLFISFSQTSLTSCSINAEVNHCIMQPLPCFAIRDYVVRGQFCAKHGVSVSAPSSTGLLCSLHDFQKIVGEFKRLSSIQSFIKARFLDHAGSEINFLTHRQRGLIDKVIYKAYF